jgi:hypothetical protein
VLETRHEWRRVGASSAGRAALRRWAEEEPALAGATSALGVLRRCQRHGDGQEALAAVLRLATRMSSPDNGDPGPSAWAGRARPTSSPHSRRHLLSGGCRFRKAKPATVYGLVLGGGSGLGGGKGLRRQRCGGGSGGGGVECRRGTGASGAGSLVGWLRRGRRRGGGASGERSLAGRWLRKPGTHKVEVWARGRASPCWTRRRRT